MKPPGRVGTLHTLPGAVEKKETVKKRYLIFFFLIFFTLGAGASQSALDCRDPLIRRPGRDGCIERVKLPGSPAFRVILVNNTNKAPEAMSTYGITRRYGAPLIVAHNYREGWRIANLHATDVIYVWLYDGRMEKFVVIDTQIISNDANGYRLYGHANKLYLQTCVDDDRVFVATLMKLNPKAGFPQNHRNGS